MGLLLSSHSFTKITFIGNNTLMWERVSDWVSCQYHLVSLLLWLYLVGHPPFLQKKAQYGQNTLNCRKMSQKNAKPNNQDYFVLTKVFSNHGYWGYHRVLGDPPRGWKDICNHFFSWIWKYVIKNILHISNCFSNFQLMWTCCNTL